MSLADRKAIAKLFTEIATLRAITTERSNSANIFRVELKDTLKDINTKLEALPSYVVEVKGLGRRVGWLFKLVTLSFLGLGGIVGLIVLVHIGG